MTSLYLLLQGFGTALLPSNLLFALIGCTIGTLIGVLPGIGPVAGVAILLPVTFSLGPIPSVIMLAAIYYGAMYGGTLTSVLVNVPGEAASAITCLDGHAMARQGRAGPALAVAAIGSFVAGTAATMGIVLLALPLTELALKFGPPEFFALMVVGLSLVTGLASASLLRALFGAVFGLVIALVGADPMSGTARFTFGNLDLLDGIGIVPVGMGLFGLSELLLNAEKSDISILRSKVNQLIPTRVDAARSALPILRGTGIGFMLGLIPGVGALVPTVISYVAEKRLSKTPEKFGTGMIEGVAGPESANNAYATAALIPFFTLGIPGSPTIAIIMGALMMNGLVPGPFLFRDHGDFAWAVIASLYIGNVILVFLNLPLIPLWVAVLKIPHAILQTAILTLCIIGAYSLNNSVFDVWMMALFGLVGYVFRKLDIPLAAILLTMILGPMMEQALRQSLGMSGGSLGIFLTRPIALGLLACALLFLIATSLQFIRRVQNADSEV